MSALTQLPEELYTKQPPTLTAAAVDFDMTTARAMGWASQLAYETDDPDKVTRVLSAWGWQLKKIFAGRFGSVLPLTSAKGFIATSGDISILAFAGTEPTSLMDWLLDFSIHQNAEGAHEGFLEGADAVAPYIDPVLAAGGRILITGHSLGGALAGASAYRLAKPPARPDRILGVYTFGMPRIGDAQFAAAYGNANLHNRTYRLVHGDDLVATVPPLESPFDFQHVGRPLPCSHLGTFEGTPGPYALEVPGRLGPALPLIKAALRTANSGPAFPGAAWARVIIDQLPPAIRDHIPDRYLTALGVLP